MQTIAGATSFKVQVLNALCFYFQQQKSKTNFVPQRKFSHYVIYRGTKLGVFHNFDTVRKYIICEKPIFKGYYSFKEALNAARESLGLNFYIEPEEVKNYVDVIKQDPAKIISEQAEVIKNFENQVVIFQKEVLQYDLKCQGFLKQLEYKEKTVETMERVIKGLNSQIVLLKSKIETEESSKRNFEQLKARIIDMPLNEVLKPVFNKFPDFEKMIVTKVDKDFIPYLISLQQELISIHFDQNKYEGVNVVQAKEFKEGVPRILKIQIDLNKTTMPHDEILKFYHNGMVDFIEFKTNGRILNLLENFGEKLFLIAGNIAEQGETGRLFVKIISSLPEMIKGSYRPARKMVIIDEVRPKTSSTVSPHEFNHISDEEIYKFYQKSENMENFEWYNYRMFGEGHYVQIWAHPDWKIKLPFHGEGEELLPEHFLNNNIEYGQDPYDQDDDITIPDTHRDF